MQLDTKGGGDHDWEDDEDVGISNAMVMLMTMNDDDADDDDNDDDDDDDDDDQLRPQGDFPLKRRDFRYANSMCQIDEDKLMDIKATQY